MISYLRLACLIAGFAIPILFASPAQAQATRTWVSGVGDDVNPCSRTAPCKTFAGAISKTAAAGEINCLDSGGFGGVTITKSISIICTGLEAGVLVSGTNGITVSAPLATDTVILDGLDIEGLGSGLNGVNVTGQATVIIRNTKIHHFTQNGVNVVGSGGVGKAIVQGCYISNNGGGVNVQATANNAVIDHSTIETHVSFAVQSATASGVFLSASNLIGSGPKVVLVGVGTFTSYENNVIRGVTALPTSTLPLL